MKEFILKKIIDRGGMSAGEITAVVVRKFKPKVIKGLFWKVKNLLDELVQEGKLKKQDKCYYSMVDINVRI